MLPAIRFCSRLSLNCFLHKETVKCAVTIIKYIYNMLHFITVRKFIHLPAAMHLFVL